NSFQLRFRECRKVDGDRLLLALAETREVVFHLLGMTQAHAGESLAAPVVRCASLWAWLEDALRSPKQTILARRLNDLRNVERRRIYCVIFPRFPFSTHSVRPPVRRV